MKLLLKILKWTFIVLAVLIIGLVIAVYAMYPPKVKAPFPDIKASTDSAVIAQGKYLVYGPAHCIECHSSGRSNIDSVLDHLQPVGGTDFVYPGYLVYSKNLTPDKETGIGKFSDAEVARMIRYGVKPNDEMLQPFMSFGNVSDEDLTAIISFLRSIPPVKHELPEDNIGFLMKGMIAFFIRPFGPKGEVEKSVKRDTTAAYGEYLTLNVSGCADCHTKSDEMTGKPLGPVLAGGFRTPSETEEGAFIVTPNLTPDPETGRIYTWSEQQFIERFHTGRMIKGSIMPWEAFKNYDDNDLKAVFKYLRSIPSVKNDIGEEMVSGKK